MGPLRRPLRSIATYLIALILGACIAAAPTAADKYRGGSYNNYDVSRRQQADMERFRREQEKEQRRQAREMERAQQKAQQKWTAPQWQSPQQQWQQPRQQVQDGGKIAGGQKNSGPDEKDPPKRAGNANAGKGVDDDDDDTADDDWATDAERHLKAIARERQREFIKVQRDGEALRRREEARDQRIRERSLRQPPNGIVDLVDRAPPKGAAKPVPVVPTAAETPAPPAKDGVRRWPHNASGFETRPSGLGMGRDAVKDDPSKAPPHLDSKAGEPETEPVKGGRERASSSGGSAKDGEMPPVAAETSSGSVIVSGLSDEQLEAAKEKGFSVSKDIDLKGAGLAVRRVSARGYTDAELERELHKMAPFSQSFPNFEYSIYMGTIGESEGASRKPTDATQQPCPSSTCFGTELIKWQTALATCARNVKIGIIDTSFDTDHPAFQRLKPIQGEFLGDKRPSDSDWHGTAVLSLLAGDPQSGTPGLVPNATFLLATAFRSDMNGNATTDTANLLQALDWLDQLDVDIVNMSFSGPQDGALQRAIERMSKKGVVFIAAAGNMGPTASPSYPAAYPNVIAVTAVNRKGVSYKSANRGTYVDVSAPGVDILTALPHGKQGYQTGTSFAVPFVTAILAATEASHPRNGGKKDPLEGIEIRDLGPPGPDPIYGAGLALAPPRCVSSGETVARDTPAGDAWSTRTTFMKAGTGLAP